LEKSSKEEQARLSEVVEEASRRNDKEEKSSNVQ